jgi:hypothetical protein
LEILICPEEGQPGRVVDAVHCFRIVIYNKNTNFGVWGLAAPLAHGQAG